MRTRALLSRQVSSQRRHSWPLAGLAIGLLGLPIAGCALDADDSTVSDPALAPDTEGAPRADVVPHWDSLIGRTGVTPAVRWGEHGTPMSLFGVLSAPRGAAPTEAALGFLADNARLFRLPGDMTGLAATDDFDSPGGHHVGFAQQVEGVPVHGAEIRVHFDHDGRIVGMTNTTVPNVALDVRPRISADAALATAIAGIAADRSDADAPDAPALVIRAGGGAPAALAWRVVVPTSGPTLEVFVSATTGAVLGEPVDLNRYVNGTGQVFKDNAVVATQNNNLVDSNDSNAAVPTAAYSTVTLQGLNGNNRLDGTFASGSASRRRATGSNNAFIFLRNSTSFSETMAYFHIDFAQRYIQSLGFTNVNNRQQVFSIDRLTDDNSFYSPNNRRITYGTGGVDDAEDGEVIVHEYGHSVQDNQRPGFGATEQGGAMGEGFGDYLAATVNASLTGTFQLVCIAEWDATSYAAGVPHCLRRLDSTKHFPQDADGEVHDDGEMWSASLFQIRNAIGAIKADKVILQSHFLLSTSANFKDGANALITAAINLGLTTAEVSSIRTILVNRGFAPTA